MNKITTCGIIVGIAPFFSRLWDAERSRLDIVPG